MNFTLRNILRFLSVASISVREFENTAGLQPGVINAAKTVKGELNNFDIQRILRAYGKQFNDEGFEFIELSPFGGTKSNQIGIIYTLNESDNPFDPGSIESSKWLISHHIKNDTLEKSRQKQIIINDCNMSDSVSKMNYDSFLEMISTRDYINLGIIEGIQQYQYVSNPQVGKRTYIFFNTSDGSLEDIHWSV